MRAKVLSDLGERTVALILDSGEEFIKELTSYATEHSLTAAHFTAIGAFSDATLGYFDWEQKDYQKIQVNAQVEVLSLIGDVALKDGKPFIHAHAVVGLANGETRGGHLLRGEVRPTLEIILIESPTPLERHYDRASGLALIRF